MKVRINLDIEYNETEVVINCCRMTKELERVIALLRAVDMKLTGLKDGQIFLLESEKILYIDIANKRTFIYTDEDVYETSLKLYELEDILSDHGFFRAGKSSIINFGKIRSLKTDLGGRMIVTMENSEKMIVSRQYTSYIKEKLRRYESW